MNSDITQGEPPLYADDMIIGVVHVVEIKGTSAWVESETKSACGGCAMAKGCGTKVISGYFGKKFVPLKLLNDFDGIVGDRIEVGIYNSTILKASALLYLLPLLGMIVGAIMGTSMNEGDFFSIILSIIGLISGFALTKTLYSSDHMTTSITPIFLKKLGPVNSIDNKVILSPSEVRP